MTMIWLNGEFLPADRPAILANDRGFTLGDGLFETIAVKAGVALRMEAHCRRLREGADFLGLPVPLDDQGLTDAVMGIVGANGLHDAAVRLTLTAGPAARGLPRPATLSPTLLLTVGTLPGELPPARLIIARRTYRNEKSPFSRLKVTSYLDGIIARNEALALGADDALLLNGNGHVAEATASNFFALIEGQWVTPPVADGALPGTMRASLLRSWNAVERSLLPADLDRATEMMLTTALGIRPVAGLIG